MKILTVEWGEKIKHKKYTSSKHKVKRQVCPLKFAGEMGRRISLLQFPQKQLRSGLTHQHPGGSSTFLSRWVLSKPNAAQPTELHSNEYESQAVLIAPRWHVHWSAQLQTCQQRKRWPSIFNCQENEETLNSSLVCCSGSISSSRKRTVHYTRLVCSLTHACKESQKDFCY